MADTDRTFIHRSGDDTAADLIHAYDKSLGGSVDWNGDTFRMLVAGILDALHVADPSVDAHDAREANSRKGIQSPLIPAGPQSARFGEPQSVSEIAAEVVRQLRAEGYNSPNVPPAAIEHAAARATSEPDYSIPEPRTTYFDKGGYYTGTLDDDNARTVDVSGPPDERLTRAEWESRYGRDNTGLAVAPLNTVAGHDTAGAFVETKDEREAQEFTLHRTGEGAPATDAGDTETKKAN